MIELFGLADCKRRRFFVVKRAASDKIGACFFQWNVPINRVNNIDTIQKIENERLRNHLANPITLSKIIKALGQTTQKLPSCAFQYEFQPDNFSLIKTDTLAISARPASFSFNIDITLPISRTPCAPDAAIVSAINAVISASFSGWGM